MLILAGWPAVFTQTCKHIQIVNDAFLACIKSPTVDCNKRFNYTFTASTHNYEMWHTADVQNGFENLFAASTENPGIENWDVSNAVTFNSMFKNAGAFNRSLDKWQLHAAQSFDSFLDGSSFNMPLTITAKSATSFKGMLANTPNFNQPLRITASKATVSYERMLQNATAFNSALTIVQPIGADSSVANMLRGATAFNQKLALKVAATTNVAGVLAGCTAMAYTVGCWNTTFAVGDVVTQCNATVDDSECRRCVYTPTNTTATQISKTHAVFAIISMISFFFAVGNLF
jgi:hypothetical protein